MPEYWKLDITLRLRNPLTLRTAHLLDELGLLQYILVQPHSTLTEGLVRINGKTAGGFSFSTIVPEYPYAIWIPQPIFLQALVEKAAPFSSFQCWMGARATELIEEQGTIVGVRGLRHGKEPFEIRADVVVGADGRYSAIRRLGHFDIAYEHHDFDVIWFVIEQPPVWPNTIYFSLGSDVQGLMLPKYPHHIQAGLFLPTGAWRHWREAGVAAVAERVRRLDPVFMAFADALHDFQPFFPESRRSHRRQCSAGNRRCCRTAALSAARAWTNRPRRPGHDPAAARGGCTHLAPLPARGPACPPVAGRRQPGAQLAPPQTAATATALAPAAPRAAPAVLRCAPAAARSRVQFSLRVDVAETPDIIGAVTST